MLSLTSEYALRAMIHLAQHEPQWPIPGKLIAAATNIPPKYLATVRGDLARAGVLKSTRGKTGGFEMLRPPRKTSLLDILTPFELGRPNRCPFGNDLCSDENPCMAHEQWKKVLGARDKFLHRTSIREVALRRSKTSSRARVKKKRRR